MAILGTIVDSGMEVSPWGRPQPKRLVYGTHTTVTAADVVATGLSAICVATATLATDLSADLTAVTVEAHGDTLTIRTWKPTAADNTTPTAATTFGVVVHWQCAGT